MDEQSAKNLLSKVYIAKPCPANWDEMTGDERKRFCASCQKNVYNVKQLSAVEAAELIVETEGNACLRLYRRKDGTIITNDCPVGIRLLRQAYRRIVAAVFIMLSTVFGVPVACIAQGWSLPKVKFGEEQQAVSMAAGSIHLRSPVEVQYEQFLKELDALYSNESWYFRHRSNSKNRLNLQVIRGNYYMNLFRFGSINCLKPISSLSRTPNNDKKPRNSPLGENIMMPILLARSAKCESDFTEIGSKKNPSALYADPIDLDLLSPFFPGSSEFR